LAPGFHSRFYTFYGYTGTRVLEHNQTGRFERYVEASWTQMAALDGHGRLWIADRSRHQVVFVEASTRYVPWPALYRDYAGVPDHPGHVDGFRLTARFNGPMGLAVSAVPGRTMFIYVADTGNHCIRRLDYARGRISTILGNPQQRGLRDGPGFEARFNAPVSLGIDSTGTRLFVLDNVRLVRYVDLSRPIPTVTTLAGGACRAISRQTVVASVVIRRVGCHPDWHAKEAGGVPTLEQFTDPVMCVGHLATCNPRHHPALADRHASNRYEPPAAQGA